MAKKNRGFTLIELLIVIAIIGVLLSMLVYGIQQYRQKGGAGGNGIQTTSSLPFEIEAV